MSYLEFTSRYNHNDDLEYVFHPFGDTATGKYGEHITIVTVNELGEELDGSIPIISESCSCKGFKNMRTNKSCQHLIQAKRILKHRGIKCIEIELARYWCPTCHKESTQIPGQEIKCDCGQRLLECSKMKKK